jgi:hypothetical protein
MAMIEPRIERGVNVFPNLILLTNYFEVRDFGQLRQDFALCKRHPAALQPDSL